MRQDARIATLIELVDKAINNFGPVDNMLKAYFRDHRFIGGGDRRYLSDMLYQILRRRYELEHRTGGINPRRMVICFLQKDHDLDVLFTGDKYAPAPVTSDELKFNNTPTPPEMPSFLLKKLQETFPDSWQEELIAFNQEARFDLRANTLKAPLERIKDKTKAIKSPLSRLGLYFDHKFNITQTDSYKDGLIDIQDEGSQLICEFCDAKSGDKILDLCAGSGGKSLTLAILMNNIGSITAHDINPARMKDLMPRANRSGISIINTSNHTNQKYDMVLIDAPCSGSGTIRRNVDKKWKITHQTIQELTAIQADILHQASKLSNKIIYATCSFIREENDLQIERFLKSNPKFSKTNERFLSPFSDGTDSFYMCHLEKK